MGDGELTTLASSRSAGGRKRGHKVRFCPPKTAQVVDVAAEEAKYAAAHPDRAEQGVGRWPPEIPPDMVFAHRAVPKERGSHPFASQGAQEMYEHTFQVHLLPPQETMQPWAERNVKYSPSQSSDAPTDEPRTPADVYDTDSRPLLHANLEPRHETKTCWARGERLPNGTTLSHDGIVYSPRAHMQQDQDKRPSSHPVEHGNSRLDISHPPSLMERTGIHPTASFSSLHRRQIIEHPYEERRASFDSSRTEMTGSPFDSQPTSESSQLSGDDFRFLHLRRPHQTILSPVASEPFADPSNVLSEHIYMQRFPFDHPLSSYPSLYHLDSGRQQEVHYPYAEEPYTRSPLHSTHSSLMHHRDWIQHHGELVQSTTDYPDNHDLAGHGPRELSASTYHFVPHSNDSLFHPIHGPPHPSFPPDRQSVHPEAHGAIADPTFNDRIPRHSTWHAHEIRSDPHGPRPSLMPGAPVPAPVYLHGPPHYQVLPPFPAFDRFPGFGLAGHGLPFRSDLPRRVSWTDHFDYLQSQTKKRRRISKTTEEEQIEDEPETETKSKKQAYQHPCPLCDRTFARRNSLAIHMKWHYKDRSDPSGPNALGIYISEKPGNNKENSAANGPTHVAENLLAESPSQGNKRDASLSTSAENSKSDRPAPMRSGVLSISSLLSTDHPNGIAAPITPLATPPTTPTTKGQHGHAAAILVPSGGSHARGDTTGSVDSAVSWSDSLFGPEN